MLINSKKYKIERAVAKRESNPVAVLLFLLLNDMRRRLIIETTPIVLGDKTYEAQPDKVVERIKKMIVLKRLGAGFEYRFYNDQLQCDIRVISDTRSYEDWDINNYK